LVRVQSCLPISQACNSLYIKELQAFLVFGVWWMDVYCLG